MRVPARISIGCGVSIANPSSGGDAAEIRGVGEKRECLGEWNEDVRARGESIFLQGPIPIGV
jgi:hypothetical protein